MLLQRPLSYRNVRGFGDIFARQVTRKLAGWRDGDTIDLQAEMSELTLAILAETMFSGDLSGAIETIESFNQARNDAFTRRAVDPTWTPGSDPDFQAALAALDEFIFGMIAARQAEPEPKDILGMLVHAVDREEAQLDDRAVRDESVGLIYAGHTTTANTLTFALALLALHPDVTRALRAQVVEAVGDRLPTTAELDEKIPLAREVIEETMRLYPVGDVIDRRARADLELGDYFIPAGTGLVFSAWLPQHDERYFPDPERFDPGRFSAERRKRDPARTPTSPSATGRRCASGITSRRSRRRSPSLRSRGGSTSSSTSRAAPAHPRLPAPAEGADPGDRPRRVTTVAEAVAGTAAALGARDAFGLVGSGNLQLANALVSAGVFYHGACHEAGAVAMADGYARVSGSVGMATVHQGPGSPTRSPRQPRR